MRRILFLVTALLLLAATFVQADDNQLSQQEKAEGWKLLFNGEDYSGWKCNNGKEVATTVEDGCMLPHKSGGYVVVYDKQFDDFILKCDVKWDAKQCNSGIFFRIGDLSNPVHTGFEAQVKSGSETGLHSMGAIYDLVAPTKNTSHGGGEWNHLEIRCQGPHISVKLNGEQVAQLNCDEFTEPGKRLDGTTHKFKVDGKPVAVKDFPRKGYLGFQDHGQKVWYKNVKLKELD